MIDFINHLKISAITLSLKTRGENEEANGKTLILSEWSVDKSRCEDDTKNEAEELSSPA